MVGKIAVALISFITALQAETLAVGGVDTVHYYEKIIHAEPGAEALRIYAFPSKVYFGPSELAARTMADSLPLIHQQGDALFSGIWRAVYETAEEVHVDSSGLKRLGLRSVRASIEYTYKRSSEAVAVEVSECPKMVAAGDTLVRGPYQGQPRCSAYLTPPVDLFKAAGVEALLTRTHASFADSAVARKTAVAAEEAAIESTATAAAAGMLIR